MTINLGQIFDGPNQFLFAFEHEDALFVEMDRGAYHRSIFLDRRISPKGDRAHRMAVAPLFAQLDQAKLAQPDICYIFHVAHCGSTLLARALDVPDANLVYREPMTLRHLGVLAAAAEQTTTSDAWAMRLRLATAMLGRRYNRAGPVVVKVNVPVNFMLGELMQLNPRQPAILLYATLENYLLAVMRSQDHQRWVERVTAEVGHGMGRHIGGFEPGHGVAKTAAQLWLAQMLIFDDTLRRFPAAVSLDAEGFFGQPRQVLAAAFRHFGQTRSDQDIETTVSGDLFSRYSKNPALEFSNERRIGLRDQVRSDLRQEIAEARQWIEQRPAFARLPRQMARPLVGVAGDLA